MAANNNHREILPIEIEYLSKKWHLYLNGGLIKTASRSQDLIEHILFLRNLVYNQIDVLEITNRNSGSVHRVNHWRLARLVLDAEERMQTVETLSKHNNKIRESLVT